MVAGEQNGFFLILSSVVVLILSESHCQTLKFAFNDFIYCRQMAMRHFTTYGGGPTSISDKKVGTVEFCLIGRTSFRRKIKGSELVFVFDNQE